MEYNDLFREIYKTTFVVYSFFMLATWLSSLKAGKEDLDAYQELFRLRLIKNPYPLVIVRQ